MDDTPSGRTRARCRRTHTGDIDNNGNVDIIAASWADHRSVWQENGNGSGHQWNEVSISYNADGVGSGPTTVHGCDMDGDGDLDIVVGSLKDPVLLPRRFRLALLSDATLELIYFLTSHNAFC